MDDNNKFRIVIVYKDYFEKFFVRQNEKAKSKIIWTLALVEEIRNVPETYLRHIYGIDGLYEIRVQQGSDIFRIFCFFDENRLVILANGFQKKKQKTPKKEILKAVKIMEEYFSEKR